MRKRWAIVKDDVVANVIVWDGKAEYSPPAGCVMIDTSKTKASLGWKRQGKSKKFAPDLDRKKESVEI